MNSRAQISKIIPSVNLLLFISKQALEVQATEFKFLAFFLQFRCRTNIQCVYFNNTVYFHSIYFFRVTMYNVAFGVSPHFRSVFESSL